MTKMPMLAVAGFLCAGGFAHADAASRCATAGDVLFQVDAETNIDDGPSSHLVLYHGGAWTLERFNGEAPPSPKLAGCLSEKATSVIASRLAAARWTVTGTACLENTMETTSYRVAGNKLVWTESCGQLDAKSRESLAAILAVLEAER
jgi:hypothetical protein